MSVPGTDLQGWRWLRGRARRREFWLWAVVIMGWDYVALWADDPLPQIVLSYAFLFQVIRRLHDIGISGWWVVAFLIALIGATAAAMYPMSAAWMAWLPALLMLSAFVGVGAFPGQPRPNRFGPPPGGGASRPSAARQPLGETFG